VKWSLHAREEIILELLQHLRGNIPRHLLEGLRNNTREMLEEQEAVRGRLFTIQDNIQSNIRSWLQVCPHIIIYIWHIDELAESVIDIFRIKALMVAITWLSLEDVALC